MRSDGPSPQGEAFRLYWRDRWPNGPEEFDMEWEDFVKVSCACSAYGPWKHPRHLCDGQGQRADKGSSSLIAPASTPSPEDAS